MEQAKLFNVPTTSYAPIAQSFCSNGCFSVGKMEKKFDVCYLHVLAKEDVVFKKYPVLCQLEARHGVDTR